ncbi:MAG: hypothetical protein LBT81_00990 [Helicobacteraceae bacterium]|jgi:hypothetical protein|nr:hypothetical protein [Helicobacteraceae bacterium]
MSINYVWTGNKTLNIDLFYSDGMTNLWLSQKNNGVETITTCGSGNAGDCYFFA